MLSCHKARDRGPLLDNLTHTLAGLFVADVALTLRASRVERRTSARAVTAGAVTAGAGATASGADAGFRRAALTTSALANNLPDLDFVYTGITGGKLGYLLHHRGHTHTLALALPLALACVGGVTLVLRALGARLGRGERGWLFGLALFGSVLHVAMDFGNNYGVHPFWPLDNSWYYGDVIFIVEPWLIVILAGSTFMATSSRVLRALLAACVLGLLALAVVSELGGVTLAVALALFAAGWFAWTWRAPAVLRARATLGLLLGFGAVWLASRERARSTALEGLPAEHRARASVVSTPLPGNPFCWAVLSTAVLEDDQYVARQAVVAPWPALLGAQHCAWPGSGATAPLRATDADSSASLWWGAEFRAPIRELRETARRDCVARAFLRFARVPFWIQSDGRTRVIGDLRYDRSAAIDFAELLLSPGTPCPRFEPPWEPPFSLESP